MSTPIYIWPLVEGEASVSVNYLVDQNDVERAARVARRVLPHAQQQRRLQLAVAGVLVVLAVVLFAVGGEDARWVAWLAALVGAMYALVSSSWMFGFLSSRAHVSRQAVGDKTFSAGPSGVSIVGTGMSATYDWAAVHKVGAGEDAVVLTISPRIFLFVPGRALSDRDRSTLRNLAIAAPGGPEWVDLTRAGTRPS